MACPSTVQKDSASLSTEAPLAAENQGTSEDDDVLVLPSRHKKRQLVSNNQEEWKRRNTKRVRTSNKNNAIADTAHEDEDSDDMMPDDNIQSTPSFNGGRVLLAIENNSTSSNYKDNYLLEDLHLQQSKLEKRFLQPLLVAIQRQSNILKDVVDKQSKIIRGLRRRHVSHRFTISSRNPFRVSQIFIESAGSESHDLVEPHAFKTEMVCSASLGSQKPSLLSV
jgi:hypothetical protein